MYSLIITVCPSSQGYAVLQWNENIWLYLPDQSCNPLQSFSIPLNQQWKTVLWSALSHHQARLTAFSRGVCKAAGADFCLLREDIGLSGWADVPSKSTPCSCGQGGGLNRCIRHCSGAWWILSALVHLHPILHAEQHRLSWPPSSFSKPFSYTRTMLHAKHLCAIYQLPWPHVWLMCPSYNTYRCIHAFRRSLSAPTASSWLQSLLWGKCSGGTQGCLLCTRSHSQAESLLAGFMHWCAENRLHNQ